MDKQLQIQQHLNAGKNLWLFLDYDGTLVEFSSTPDTLEMNQDVVDLIKRLSDHPQIKVAVISGRRLGHIRQLLPIPGIFLGGTYGIELLLANGEEISRFQYSAIRPVIEEIKPQWEKLIENEQGFFLEDKGYALALHAGHAADEAAHLILGQARKLLKTFDPAHPFRILGGHKFLEVGPVLANKGETVLFLLDRFVQPEDLCVYVGDDDKDEEAFKVIESRQGITVQVGSRIKGEADIIFNDPVETLTWLRSLLKQTA